MTEQIAGFDVEQLHGPAEISCAEDELVVACLVRDGLPWVKSFVEHHFSLGAKHLVFLDNGSSDGTVEALGRYDRVTVLRTGAPYRGNEGNMRRYLIDRFGRGRWCLSVDMDELFDYPYSDVVPLNSLLGYLNGKSYTAVTALMLDVFPERLSSLRAESPDEDRRREHRFYDTSSIEKVRLSEDAPAFRGNVFDDEAAAVEFRGSIRDDLFGFKGPRRATKYPLLFSDGSVKHVGPHRARGARVADLACVLFHYKFYAFSLQGYWQNVLDQKKTKRDPHSYERYKEVLENPPDVRLRRDTSKELSGVNELLEDGLLFVSRDYTDMVETRKAQSRSRVPTVNGAGEESPSPKRGQRSAKGSGGGRKAAWSLKTLKDSGIRPRTVVDVGVGQGTPQLYDAFPKAFHVLVEPLQEHEPALRDILTRYEGEYLVAAIGSSKRKGEINVEPNSVLKSSLQERTAKTATGDTAEKREVPVTTLDALMIEHGLQPPFGLKIDAEGFELEVVRGGPKFLRKTQFVTAEVSVAERFVGGYSFTEFTEAMARNGFFLSEILNPGRGRIVDAVFRPAFNYQPTSLLLHQVRLRARNIARAIGRRRA